ncbi:MAG: 50S ribosomal protein L3 [Alphaproteobacteria bacterium]|nr:MAG: 50S ribosomal protein L3 [Alphaproteobacteria bacterium]
MRSGVIAKKIGMTRVFNEGGQHIPVTVLQMDTVQVVGVRNKERDGYTAVQLGAGSVKVKNVSAAMRGHFAKASVLPKRKIAEFRVSEDAMLDVGATLAPSHFVPGQIIDVVGTSHGRVRWGNEATQFWWFARLSWCVTFTPLTRFHRSVSRPWKVFKGKKMAGHLGPKSNNTKSEIVTVDDESGVILVQGSVPGPKNGWILITDAVKKIRPDSAPFPAGLLVENSNVQNADETIISVMKVKCKQQLKLLNQKSKR